MPRATTADLMTGRRGFDRAARALDRLTAIMSVFGTLGILGLMAIIVADVVARAGLNRPLAGVPEIVAMSILAIVFLQLPNTVARGQLTRADMMLTLLDRRNAPAGLLFDALMHAAGALLTGILVWAFLPLFLRTWARNEMVGTVGQFMAPLWPVHFIVLLGSAVLCLVFAMRAVALALLALSEGQHERD